jgi:EmrB/QacA subfamily drug resistance transporter
MVALNVGSIKVALPILSQTLQADFYAIQWVILSYLLIITVFVLTVARLGDMFGKKRLYLTGLVIFTISSLLCSLSPSINWLIGFRVLQGLGAVCISGLGAALIVEVFPPAERGRALGINSSLISFGIALGPLLAGWLIKLSNWRSIFWINIPISMIASVIISYFVPLVERPQVKRNFDGIGAIVLTIALGCFTLGVTLGQRWGFGSRMTLVLLGIAAIAFWSFVLLESYSKQPMLDLHMLQNRQLSLSLLCNFLVFVVVSGSTLIMPFFLKLVQHYSVQQIGLLIALSPSLAGLVAPLAGALADRLGVQPISIAGLILLAIGCLLISTFDSHLSELNYLLCYTPFGLGLGLFQSPNHSAIMGSVSRERLGMASGLLTLSRTLGQLVGVPLISTLFSGLVFIGIDTDTTLEIINAPTEALIYSLQGTFRIEAIVILVAVVTTYLAWRAECCSAKRFEDHRF